MHRPLSLVRLQSTGRRRFCPCTTPADMRIIGSICNWRSATSSQCGNACIPMCDPMCVRARALRHVACDAKSFIASGSKTCGCLCTRTSGKRCACASAHAVYEYFCFANVHLCIRRCVHVSALDAIQGATRVRRTALVRRATWLRCTSANAAPQIRCSHNSV
eukprot:4435581-Pleurochrysis_carterae.AAC.4